MRPVLLVDIDGVRAPYGSDSPPSGFTPYDLFPEDGEPTFLAEIHGHWLQELNAHFDMVWASAWGHDANRLIGPVFDLPAWPFVPYPTDDFAPAEKVPAIDVFVGDLPCAWVEDLMTGEAFEWAATRSAPTLLIGADPAVGLTREVVDDLLSWCVGQAGRIMWFAPRAGRFSSS